MQFVQEDTRFDPSGNSSLLDLIFSTDPLSISITEYLPPFSTSDHSTISFSIFTPPQPQPSPTTSSDFNSTIILPTFKWNDGDYVAINHHLSTIDWHSLFGFNFDVESLWSAFKSIIWPIISLYVPTRMVAHYKKYKVRHYPKIIRNLLSRKAAIWRTYRCTRHPGLKAKYTEIANKCKMAILNFDKKREDDILKANNLGAFYKYVNRNLSSPTGVAPLIDQNGNLLTSDIDKSTLLNHYFESIFTHDNGSTPNFPSRTPPNCPGINDIHITPSLITRTLGKLKKNSAAGPDRLPPIFFHNTSSFISFPLSILFRTFVDSKSLPQEWKHSIITPKLKKGSPSNPHNYRPIALTCTCCKIFETLVASDLTNYLLSHNLINKQQHGFLKNHSTTTNLLESINDWTISLSNHNSVVVGYIDFTRAFDTVVHLKLFQKLQAYGISGNLLFWIQAFLTNRTQSVKVGSSISASLPVTSGVPQGSVLGPMLFNLFINDLTDPLNSITVKLFADDVKLYTNLTLPQAATNFQSHLDYIKSWADTWQLTIANSKCNILELGPHPSNTTFSISGTPIELSNTVKDLGVTIDSKLKFTQHITDIVRRAHQRASLIYRSFISRDTCILIRALKTYVRPLVEYASQIWSPTCLHLITKLESVQRAFTKKLPGLSKLTYDHRLRTLNLQSLEHRRLLSDLMTCFKIIRGFTSITLSDIFVPSPNTTSRGHPFRLLVPLAKTNTRKRFFTCRIIKIWNSLPLDTVCASSPLAFKHLTSRLDLSKFLTFPCITSPR